MYRQIPDQTPKAEKLVRVSPWTTVPDAPWCAMRFVEGTDANDVANRVAFIEKTPRVRVGPYLNWEHDWRNWYEGWKGDNGHCPKARGWCDQNLLLMGYEVPDALPFEDSMLD